MTRDMEEAKGNKKGKVQAKKAGTATIMVYSFIYVSNRYEYERELMEIEKLTKRRDLLRNNLLTLKSEFTSKTRQTQMEKLLKQRNSELEPMTRPMYSIEK